MKVLAISGSLREKSYNTAIIKTLAILNTEVEVYEELGKLPFFNPDFDQSASEKKDSSPLIVRKLREKIAQADTIIISSPEYAFEISGVLKNALDWLVSSQCMVEKSVAVITASTSGMGGDKANDVLCGLVKVLSGKDAKARLMVDRVNKKITDEGEVTDAKLFEDLKNLLAKM